MTDVPQAYQDHLAIITGTSSASLEGCWEPDGLLEFPYADSLGTAKRLEGIDAITGYFEGLAKFGTWHFRDTRCWSIDGAPEYVLEMHGSSTLLATGAAYEQDYVVRFGLSPASKLAWMREFWDPTRA